MKRRSEKGFTMIEMVMVIVAVGIIGSMAATMLFQGADIFVSETNRQGFVSESRSAFWRLMRDTQGQTSPTDFTFSDQNSLFVNNSNNEFRDFQTNSSTNCYDTTTYKKRHFYYYRFYLSYLGFKRSKQ